MRIGARSAYCVLWAVALVCVAAFRGACQEEGVSSQSSPAGANNWVWGEVVSVDNSKRQLTVRFLDETSYYDEQMIIRVNDATHYEGAAALLDIKPFDTVIIDYAMSNIGEALAQKITVSHDSEGGVFEILPEDMGQ